MTELLGVQKAALQASAGKFGFAYFLEQGLGKTLLTLTDFIGLVAEGKCTRMAVVCPNSFKHGWVEEIQKYKIDVDYHIYESGGSNERFLRGPFERPPVLIINYEAIRRPVAFSYILKFARNRDCMIVFDESIQLKTNNSLQTKAAIELAKSFKYSRVLSGKPVVQGPHDLWGQYRAIGELNGTNYYSFRGVFCKMGGYMGRVVTGSQNEDILASRIAPFTFRATKMDWTDLPPKMYTSRGYRLSAEQQAQYNAMERDFMLWLNDQENVEVDAAITKYIKLAQIQSGFIIDEEKRVRKLVEPTHNPRLILLKEIVDDSTGKILIPYFHRYSGEMLAHALAEYQPAYIHGNMADAEISAQKKLFNEDPKCRIILAQIRATKYGHTLLGGPEPENRCSTMVFFENTYSLDDRSQIEDRIHRHGQIAESVLYIDLWGTPLDHKVTLALQRKESIFKAVFEGLRKKHGNS